jgi:hypothetical protein
MNIGHEQGSLSQLRLAHAPHPQPPWHDGPAAGQLLNAVLARAGQLNDELVALANRHLGAASTGSRYVLKLKAAIARGVLDWVQEWPRQSTPY